MPRVATLAVLLLASAVSAQTPAPARPAPQTTPAAPQPQPLGADSYTYEPDGRRDPFLSLIGTGTGEPRPLRRGDGTGGLSVGEISVRGIVESRGTLVAMVQGPDNRSYIVHQGDRFVDGTIKSITAQGLIIIQQVNDPLSLVKQREVRKLLRSGGDAKQ